MGRQAGAEPVDCSAQLAPRRRPCWAARMNANDNDNWCRIDLEFACALAELLRLAGPLDWPGPFRCSECGEPVEPRAEREAHFHHIGNGAECSLRRGASNKRRGEAA